MVNVEIIGIEQVHEILNELPKRYNKTILYQAAKKSVEPIKSAAISNVPSETVKKQIAIWPLRKSPLAGAWAGWSPTRNEDAYRQAQGRAKKMWALLGGLWLEYGTSGKWVKRDRICRKIEPVGWFRRAVDMNIDNVEKSFMGDVLTVLNRFLDKKIKHYGI